MINSNDVIFTTHDIVNHHKIVNHVVCDADGDCQFLSTENNSISSLMLITYEQICIIDKSLILFSNITVPFEAVRLSIEDEWRFL